jgi:hypothetical protein
MAGIVTESFDTIFYIDIINTARAALNRPCRTGSHATIIALWNSTMATNQRACCYINKTGSSIVALKWRALNGGAASTVMYLCLCSDRDSLLKTEINVFKEQNHFMTSPEYV